MIRAESPSAQAAWSTGLRRVRLLAALAVSVLAVWTIDAGTASADYRHVTQTAEFGPDGTAATSFGNIKSISYQQANHRLFVLDAASGIVGLSRSAPGALTPLGGAFPIGLPSLGPDPDLAVDNSAGSTAGNIYLAPDGPTISGYGPNGAPLATIYDARDRICGVAVDSAGDIWSGRPFGGSAAVEFTPGSATIKRAVSLNTGGAIPCRVAIDPSNDDLYASSSLWGFGVGGYTAASGYLTGKYVGGAEAANNRVAVNGAKHVVYIGGENSNGKISAFSTVTGNLLETIELPGTAIRGLAVDEGTDTLMVAMGDANRVLEIPVVVAPKASTGEPPANAEVGGTADSDGAGPIVECYFEFGPTSAYGSRQNCAQSLPINAPTTVTAALPGLVREETYHYRLVVETATPGMVIRGADRMIVPRHVSRLKTEAMSKIGRTTGSLNASFDGSSEETTYYFEYGTSPDDLQRFPVAPSEGVIAPSTGPAAISAPLSGLTVSTFYLYRVVAENSQGISITNWDSFQTLPAVNAVVTEAATDITKTTATLHGSYDGATNDTPPGPLEDFHYYFEWGPSYDYDNMTAVPPGDSGGAHAETVHVSAQISSLQASLPDSQPYHYRLVVSNSTGTTFGPDMTFMTQPPDKPVVRDLRAEAIQPTSATVAASINPGSIPTTYRIQYGISSRYNNTTPDRALVPGSVDQPISVPLGGLARGTVYHYRVVATNSSGVTESPDQTFTTPSIPVIESSEAAAGTNTARLTVSVVANARPTEVRFEYGAGASYGSVTAPIQAGSSLLAQAVSVDLGGLQPGTTYYFRGLAGNEIGTATGPDQTFTTQLAPASIPAPLARPKPKPKSCKRAFVKRKGKCVRKHKKPARKGHKRGKAASGGSR
jgi:hypothetical protein